MAVIAAFIVLVLTPGAETPLWSNAGSNFNLTLNLNNQSGFQGTFNFFTDNPIWLLLASVIGLVIGLGVVVFTIFISGPVEVGGRLWFLQNREQPAPPSFALIFSMFRGGNWLPISFAIFWRNLWLALWSLVFLVPMLAASIGFYLITNQGGAWTGLPTGNGGSAVAGLILVILFFISIIALVVTVVNRSYAYQFQTWLLAEEPGMGGREALKRSIEMSRGYRFEMFVLDLSFIGWYILGALALGIGVVFVEPYHKATWTELFVAIRSQQAEASSSMFMD